MSHNKIYNVFLNSRFYEIKVLDYDVLYEDDINLYLANGTIVLKEKIDYYKPFTSSVFTCSEEKAYEYYEKMKKLSLWKFRLFVESIDFNSFLHLPLEAKVQKYSDLTYDLSHKAINEVISYVENNKKSKIKVHQAVNDLGLMNCVPTYFSEINFILEYFDENGLTSSNLLNETDGKKIGFHVGQILKKGKGGMNPNMVINTINLVIKYVKEDIEEEEGELKY